MKTRTDIIVASDYYINYYGQVIDIKNTKSLFIRFESGAGNGDQSYWCSFKSFYKVYKQTKENLGIKLECVGYLNEYSGTNGCGFSGEIMGQKIVMKDVTCDQVFRKIFKR